MTHNSYELSLFTRFLLWLLSTRSDVVKVNVGSPVNYLERCYSNSYQ